MVCAGWLVGRGPLAAPVGLRPRGRRGLLVQPRTIVALTGILLAGVVLVYGIWQPLRSADADGAATAAAEAGQLGQALADERGAVSDFTVSLTAREHLADFELGAGEKQEAVATLRGAVSWQAGNPYAWIALGCVQMKVGPDSSAAASFHRAVGLFYAYPPVDDLFNEATTKARSASYERAELQLCGP